MFGLEFLCKLYNMQQTELAEKVGVSKQIVNIWMKKTRPIPKKYYDKLSEIFGGLDSKYFSKELTELDKLEIQMNKLDNEWIAEEYEEEAYDPVTGEYEKDKNGNIIMIKRIATDIGQEQYYEMLKYEIDEAKLINRLKQTLAEIFYKAQLNENYIYGDELTEAYSILNLYELFIKILEKGGVSRNTLRNILTGISNYQKKDFDENNNNDLAVKITNIIKDEEDRLRKETEYWLEMSKGMEDLFK
ncbi:helix-turn-helix domain-containing protein [Clostridium botulinum]|uniref:helix-turn-helix domain-containing protein n=1 Tax=Clostridium botulinum TaxID=1491 RepID=UPI0014016C7F|nr:helix-turn-helix domain-containing protein [Clostridium botulinum]MBY6835999.1 helix-turn-helix domain-containing protein [Clostridium botulinum]NFG65782.1 helix-turn-helix domain-containing protein [Clostridium botulinum]NFO80327.1 helix-turn-helix domain-containing protein [Clostridium botulinum]NFQ22618.1 helix-turn-helix domain-containing protein [Clostridium botulinum]